MPKGRKRVRTLRDKYYQYLYFNFDLAAMNGGNAQNFGLRLPDIPTQYISSTKSLLREFLFMDYQWDYLLADIAATDIHNYAWFMTYRPVANILEGGLHQPNCILYDERQEAHEESTAVGFERSFRHLSPIRHDFQSSGGYGRLIAVSEVNIGGWAQNSGVGNVTFSIRGRIAYRFVTVSLTEYIGLLSEQSYIAQ